MFRSHAMRITLRIAVILSPVISTSSSLRIKAAYVQANSADILYPIQSKTIKVSGFYFVYISWGHLGSTSILEVPTFLENSRTRFQTNSDKNISEKTEE